MSAADAAEFIRARLEEKAVWARARLVPGVDPPAGEVVSPGRVLAEVDGDLALLDFLDETLQTSRGTLMASAVLRRMVARYWWHPDYPGRVGRHHRGRR